MFAVSEPVAKKNKKPAPEPERPKDYHASGFMIRLPEEYRKKLARIQKLAGTGALTESTRYAIDDCLNRLEDEAKKPKAP